MICACFASRMAVRVAFLLIFHARTTSICALPSTNTSKVSLAMANTCFGNRRSQRYRFININVFKFHYIGATRLNLVSHKTLRNDPLFCANSQLAVFFIHYVAHQVSVVQSPPIKIWYRYQDCVAFGDRFEPLRCCGDHRLCCTFLTIASFLSPFFNRFYTFAYEAN